MVRTVDRLLRSCNGTRYLFAVGVFFSMVDECWRHLGLSATMHLRARSLGLNVNLFGAWCC